MELPKATSLCPMCSRALKISTSEPHPTRDGVNVLTYRCSIHEDIWMSLVSTTLNGETAEPEIALPPK